MNLAQFYSMIQFSSQKTSTSKQTAKVTATATTTTTAAITTAIAAVTSTVAASGIATTSTTTKTTTTSNQFPPTIMTAATAAIGYSNGILYLPHDTINNNSNNNNNNNTNNISNIRKHDEEDNDDTDSLASMETLSDNVSIWVDGEKHWVSGVDANTTCMDLINALLSYQDQDEQLCDEDSTNNNNSNNNQDINNSINQSMLNTKEAEPPPVVDEVAELNSKKSQNLVERFNAPADAAAAAASTSAAAIAACRNEHATYVIVKQHRHCEEFLDGSTKVFDVLPMANGEGSGRKEHQLFLRRLTHSQNIAASSGNLGLGSLLSTDKDSGMGSPVGSSRSARLRRKKHKSTISWLAQANTLHPKLSQRGSAANERLLKIIMAQDETIHRQLTLLREKERQISKIEEENHRTRERELGKNYLLETYLNGLDEAVADDDDFVEGEEIFIDEPLQCYATKTTIAAPTSVLKPQHKQHHPHHERKHKPHKQRSSKHSKAATKATTTDAAAATASNDVNTAATNIDAAASKEDIEMQILWMEKIYALNKQLQKEEELLLKLHSKIRKHHTRRAQHSKQQLQQQIDEIDSNLALQCVDIRKMEETLDTSEEQLQQKLALLERLNRQLDEENEDVVVEQQQQQKQPQQQQQLQQTPADHKVTGSTQAALTTTTTSEAEIITQTTTVAAAPLDAVESATFAKNTKLSLHEMQSAEDLLSLQQLIAKPQVAAEVATTATANANVITANTALTPANATANYQLINHVALAAAAGVNKNSFTTAELQQQPQQQHLNDKLHALHCMKTVKKQMFGPKAIIKPPLPAPAPPTPALAQPPAPTMTQPSPSPAAAVTAPTLIGRPPPLILLADTLDFTQIGTLV